MRIWNMRRIFLDQLQFHPPYLSFKKDINQVAQCCLRLMWLHKADNKTLTCMKGKQGQTELNRVHLRGATWIRGVRQYLTYRGCMALTGGAFGQSPVLHTFTRVLRIFYCVWKKAQSSIFQSSFIAAYMKPVKTLLSSKRFLFWNPVRSQRC